MMCCGTVMTLFVANTAKNKNRPFYKCW
jgi:hypothetical protein